MIFTGNANRMILCVLGLIELHISTRGEETVHVEGKNHTYSHIIILLRPTCFAWI